MKDSLQENSVTTQLVHHENLKLAEEGISREPSSKNTLAPLVGNAHFAVANDLCEVDQPEEDEAQVSNATRKRSAGSAGHDEAPENGRLKSKRIRNRDSNAEAVLQVEEGSNNSVRYFEDQLNELTRADKSLFEVSKHLLSRLGVENPGSLEDLRMAMHPASTVEDGAGSNAPADEVCLIDIRSALTTWSEENANAANFGYGSSIFGDKKAGLTLLYEHSKTALPKSESYPPFSAAGGLAEFVSHCNEGWYNIHQVAFRWLESLTRSNAPDDPTDVRVDLQRSCYLRTLWPETLKLTVVQLIVREDDYIYEVMNQRYEDLMNRLAADGTPPGKFTLADVAIVDMAETLYELHLDIYSRITNPSSQVDTTMRVPQHDRLQRWSNLAGSFANVFAKSANEVSLQHWHVLRFIWAATMHANMTDSISQEHIILCLSDLQNLLRDAGDPVIILPNNAALPKISLSAVEQEISRISTLDFFVKVFTDDSSDPVGVIESLEPILEPCRLATSMSHTCAEDSDSLQYTSSETQRLIAFLEAGDASLKLFLWRRLRDAYVAIEYPTKVVSCHLRSIEAISFELSSQRHLHSPNETRVIATLKWIKELSDHMAQLLSIALSEPSAFDVIDGYHLRTSLSSIARLSRILHGVALFEDAVRIGQLPEPKGRNAAGTKSLEKFRERLRNLFVSMSTFQYILLREALIQNSDVFVRSDDERAAYLGALHTALGLRGYCKYSNKRFLRLARSEFVAIGKTDKYGSEIAQVIFDLNQVKLIPGTGDLNHGCPPEALDRLSAMHILGGVVLQARKMKIKDLLKSELKGTIDKIQQALGAPKSTASLSYNKRVINVFLKSPINQLQIFRASRGEGNLPIRAIQTESAEISRYGWYFLLGRLALAKFKSVKRTNPGPTDDLDVAIGFLKQDLEHGIEKWETWFRLAQAYDAKIEEDLLWTAEKVSNHRTELATLQRSAIHCYEMAMAMAMSVGNDADDTTVIAHKLSEMYTCFATRLYASSREPLNMDAFDTSHYQRHYSSSTLQSKLYRGPSTPSIRPFTLWRFGAHLLRRALDQKPQTWMNNYMLGKCLWKMLTHPEQHSQRRVQVQEVLDAFSEAIEHLPARKDNRADYILEPHFKIVSTVHKLVSRRLLTPLQGSEAVQVTPWARNINLAEDEEEWEPFVLEVLRKISHADKSNWHHRIIARAAHVIYDAEQDRAGALGAKHEFTQQIFTKTMTLQVWKPEFERAGRHFVYTSRYVLFFVSLLNQLNDRASLDQLVRRIRRKPGDYLNHQQVWDKVASVYVEVLRRLAKVPNGHEEAVFRLMDHDEFVAKAGELEAHCQELETSNLVLEVLRDAIELKKLNNSLMKGTLIDDLIVDCYASLFQGYTATLPSNENLKTPADPESKINSHDLNSNHGEHERMFLDSSITGQADGIVDSPVPRTSMAVPKAKLVTPATANSGIQGALARSSRPKTVTRREVQRKADGLIVRPPPIKTPTPLKHLTHSRPSVAVEITSAFNKNATSGAPMDQDQPGPSVGLAMRQIEGSRVANLMRAEAEDDVQSAVSSRPGSVHDSADNESELSEVDDVDEGLDSNVNEQGQGNRQKGSIKPAAMFSGLAPRSAGDSSEETSSSVSSDGEPAGKDKPEGMDTNTETGAEEDAAMTYSMPEVDAKG